MFGLIIVALDLKANPSNFFFLFALLLVVVVVVVFAVVVVVARVRIASFHDFDDAKRKRVF